MSKPINAEPVVTKLGYNQTHFAGLGDLIETNFPTLDQYDLDTILMQMHADVTTRKILLVGHSQGAVYANKIYDYLTTHGVPAEDVAVYAVATPDDRVAGSGKYVTYVLDDIINILVRQNTGLKPLPANLDFGDFLDSPDMTIHTPNQGHSFIDNYLGAFGTRMVADMHGEMSALKATAGAAKDGCFDPPQETLGRKVEGAALAVTDPTSLVLRAGFSAASTAVVATAKTSAAVMGAVAGTFGAAGNALGFGPKPPSAETKTSGLSALDKAGFAFMKALAGSSLTLNDLDELNGNSQGGAVALAIQKPVVQKPEIKNNPPAGEVKGAETETPSAPAPQPLNIPPLYPVGGGGSPGFGGGGGSAPPPPAPAVPAGVATTTFTFTAYDANGVSTVCSFDSAPPVACDHSFSKVLDPGPHTFIVTATDIVGNQTTKTQDFTVLP